MPLQGQGIGSTTAMILVGTVLAILASFHVRRRTTGFRSRRVRIGLDIGWGVMLFGLALWLIL